MVRGKRYILEKRFEGFPKKSDLRLEEFELPEIQNGEFLAESVFISIDPYQRAYVNDPQKVKLEEIMIGSQLAKIIDSKNPKYPVGQYVVSHFGWTTHFVFSGKEERQFQQPYIIPDFEGLPLSLSLGILGMPGNTAYFGFLDVCVPKAGETVVVSGAGGAVGSHVGQIAKIKGCKVIGILGSDEKGRWLKEIGFDHFINYKTSNIEEELKKVAPNGIDCYFDNVGGEISSRVIYQMKDFGRVSVCGSIANYNDIKQELAPVLQLSIVSKQLKIEGFIVYRWEDKWFEGIKQNLKWVKEGKVKYNETVTNGFENIFEAFTGMLRGENKGKAIVKI